MRAYLKISIAVIVGLCLALPAFAQLSPEYAEWDEGPEGFLLTKDEKKQWKKISTDAEAKRFIELFWARRNPKPDEPFNEFKAEFENRVRYADENFTSEKRRGALSDLAKVMILLGVPHYAERRAPTETVQSVGSAAGDTGMGTDEVRSNAIMWSYDPGRMPEGFKARGTRILYVFYEQKTGSNSFTLDRSHHEATMALRTLGKAPEVHFLHPDLDEVPKPISVPGGTAATAAQLAWLDMTDAAWSDEAKLIVDAGVAGAAARPIWYHLELPAEAPVLDSLAGRITTADGEVVSTFQTPTAPIETGAATRAYHLVFPIAEGSYTVQVAGATGTDVQVVSTSQQEVPSMPVDGAWLSPVWVGLTAEMEEGSLLGEPFNFGGWHLVPLAGETAPKESQLSYFGFAIRPGIGADGVPALRAKIGLKKDGKRLGQPLIMPLSAAKVTNDVYLFANSLNLAVFPEAGDFTFDFTIEDTVSDIETEREVAVTLVE